MNKEFRPKCFNTMPLSFSTHGHFLPCCYLKERDVNKGGALSQFNLTRDELKLKNCNSVDDILLSDEWIEFYNFITSCKWEDAPTPCKNHCTLGNIYKKSISQS